MRSIRLGVVRILSALTALYAWLAFPVNLARSIGALGRARNVFMVAEGGAGYTLLCPDWLRRRHAGEPNLVVFAHYPGRHNKAVFQLEGDNWPEIVAWNLFPIFPGGRAFPDTPLSYRVFAAAIAVIRWIWPTKNIIEVHRITESYPPRIPIHGNSYFAKRTERTYFETITEIPAGRVYLPAEIRSQVQKALAEHGAADYEKHCTLFARHKGTASEADQSNFRRSSSPVEDYYPAIRFLNDAGYQVLLVGDRELPDDAMSVFGNGLLDHRRLGLDRDTFMAFAGTECDILIGQQAGGSHYSHVNGIPALIVNAFPFGACIAFATMFYKTLRTADDDLIPPDRLLGEFAFDFDCAGYRLADNSAEEILSAIRDFVSNRHGKRPYGLTANEAGCPDAIESIALGNARLSPAWLRLFAGTTASSGPASPS